MGYLGLQAPSCHLSINVPLELTLQVPSLKPPPPPPQAVSKVKLPSSILQSLSTLVFNWFNNFDPRAHHTSSICPLMQNLKSTLSVTSVQQSVNIYPSAHHISYKLSIHHWPS